jgi:hypothetical protein
LGEGAVHDLSRLETEQGKAAAPDSEGISGLNEARECCGCLKSRLMVVLLFLVRPVGGVYRLPVCYVVYMGYHFSILYIPFTTTPEREVLA